MSLYWHPAPRHKLLVEGAPLRFAWLQHAQPYDRISRPSVQRSRRRSCRRLASDYVYAGYQYDILCPPARPPRGQYRRRLSERGRDHSWDKHRRIRQTAPNCSACRWSGVEFRVFPIPAAPRFSVSGGAKGMSAGAYGYFAEGRIRAGLRRRPGYVSRRMGHPRRRTSTRPGRLRPPASLPESRGRWSACKCRFPLETTWAVPSSFSIGGSYAQLSSGVD